MEITKVQLDALMRRLSRERVSQRSQSGRQLSYLEAWDVKAALIRVFGFGGFDAEVVHSEILRIEEVQATRKDQSTKSVVLQYDTVVGRNDEGKPVEILRPTMHWLVAAKATVQLTVRDGKGGQARYTEVAVAGQKGPDFGEVADFAMKTAESDALKRAAINLGTQFGLSLYNSGDLSDVVRVVLEPRQAAMLKEIQDALKEGDKTPAGQTASAVMTPRADTPDAARQIAEGLGGQEIPPEGPADGSEAN